MPRALTSDELILLRSDTQWSKLYLAVLKPNTIYTALLNGVPSLNDQVFQITFDGGSGTLSDVQPGMTLYVGTSAGAYDLGMCRIRKAPIAGTFYIGLTSDIVWQDNCYLTVVDEFDLWAKHATITDEALAMDVDIAYSDQHTNFAPVPIMGSHAVVWLDDEIVDVSFDASGSWVFDSTISEFAWSAPGSALIIDDDTALPTISYDAPGIYDVYLTVTAASGKMTTGVRHVFVFDRTDNGPSTVFQLAQCVGDYDTGGWMFDMSMQAEASLSDIRDRSLVILFAEDWYGTTKQSIGPLENRENIVCVGRVVGQSIRWDRESGVVHFTVQGLHHWLNQIKAFPVELTFLANTPTSWSVMPAMTVDKVLFHILYWHSTVIETMDFYPTNDERYVPEGKSLASKIWGQLSDIALSRLMATPGVDRLGRLHVQIDPQMVPDADRDWATVMEITEIDFSESIELQRVTVQDCSLITLSSQQVDLSGNVHALYSLSPGHVPFRFGEPEQADRLLAGDQAQSNQIAGLMMGWRRNEFPDIPVVLASNNRMFDIYPRQFAALSMAQGDTPRGIVYDGNLIPRRMSMYFDADSGYMHSEFNFEGETFEQVSTNGDVPAVEDLSVPPIPNIKIPSLPNLEPIYWGDVSNAPNGPATVILLDDNDGLLYSKNFGADGSEVQWLFANAGISAQDIPNIYDVFITPSGSIWVWVNPATGYSSTSGGGLYFATRIGAMFQKVIDYDWFIDNGYTMTDKFIVGVAVNPSKPEEIAMIAGCNAFGPFTADVNLWIGNRTGFTRGVACTNVNGNIGSMRYVGGYWIFLGEQFTFIGFWDSRLWRFVADGSAIDYQAGISSGSGAITQRILTSGSSPQFFIYRVLGDQFYVSINAGDNIDPIGDSKQGGGDVASYACTPNGQIIMGNWDTAGKGYSADYGYTWVGLPTLPPGGAYCFAYAGGSGAASRWIAARGVVRYSPDLGGSWYNKEGNLGYLIPAGMVIRKVIVPGISWGS